MRKIGRQLKNKHNAHLLSCKNNDNKSAFAQNLITKRHAMGPVEEIMDLVHTRYKSKNIDTIEKYYINHETSRGTQINGKNTTLKIEPCM